MSKEEINEIIKDFMELKEIHSSDSLRKSYLSIYKEAIQGLLDLYNKEKEKYIFEKVAKEEVEELLEDSISKDKIREKIKDLEDNMILFTNDKEKFNRYKYARDILEKLLEEE